MTTTLLAPPASRHAARPGDITDDEAAKLVPAARTSADGPDQPAVIPGTEGGSQDHTPAGPGQATTVRSWPLLILALPATVAVWSGWVGIGQMTGFGLVHPLPGIWDSLHLNTAVTLPVGVEAYAAYALRAWLSASTAISGRTRRFARRSAVGSLLLGMAGQVAYHLLDQANVARAPWPVTTVVSCLPVLVLGMGAALAHLLRADASGSGQPEFRDLHEATANLGHRPGGNQAAGTNWRDRQAEAEIAAARLAATGQRVSRRALRAAGLRGSNADLGALARVISSPSAATRTRTGQA